jgi:hypothetical protein
VTKQQREELDKAWEKRLESYIESDKLCAEGTKCAEQAYAAGNTLYYASEHKLCAEGLKICAESDKLCACADLLWIDAILMVCGDIRVEWKKKGKRERGECLLENSEVFRWAQ